MFGLHRKLIGEVPMVYSTTTAVIASAVIGAGTSYVSAEKQKSLAEDEQKKVEDARKIEQERLDTINRNTEQVQDTAGNGIAFGTSDSNSGDIGSVSEFIRPKLSLGTGDSSKKSSSSLRL